MKNLIAFIIVAIFAVLDVIGGVAFALHEVNVADHNARVAQQQARVAEQLAAQTAANYEKLTKPTSIKVTLDSVFAGNGAPHPPGKRALYLHRCDQWGGNRSAIVDKDVTVLIGRKVTSQAGFSENLTPGLEHFTVAKNPNLMTPKLFAASNWPEYTYLAYNTFEQPVTGVPSAADPMATIILYIIDVGQPIPKPGDPIPQGPGPHDPPQPSCPISSASPPASPQ